MPQHPLPSLPPGSHVLVVGAGFAGLATAWWMDRLGHQATIVEIAPGLRKGGTPVDIKEGSIETVRRMGLLEAIRARSLPPRSLVFHDGSGRIERAVPARTNVPDTSGEQYEIDRDALLDMLHAAVATRVALRFGRTITHLEEGAEGITVTFDDATREIFALVLGCDGMRSRTRQLVFGAHERHLVFLQKYGALTVLPRPLFEPGVTRFETTLGRSVIINGYADKTDLGLGFHADVELEYDHRDKARQRQLIRERFADMGGQTPVVLAALDDGDNFYFDKICQVRMPSWSQGRVVLVGDSAYCPSPFAGMGGSMALIGAAALHDAFQRHGDNIADAYQAYDDGLRPFVDMIQEQAVAFGTMMFAPATPNALAERRRFLEKMT